MAIVIAKSSSARQWDGAGKYIWVLLSGMGEYQKNCLSPMSD